MKQPKKIEAKQDDINLELEPLESEKADDIVIEHAEPNEKPKKEFEIPVELGIQELKLSLAEEKQARLNAENVSRQSVEHLKVARGEVDTTNMRLIDTAIETLKSNESVLKQNLREAMANQDVDAIVDIQGDIARLAVRKMKLEDGKADYEQKIKAPKIEVPIVLSPVEALASQLSPRSAAWVRSHPEYAQQPRLYQKMLAAHNLAVADGLPEDSDEYFESVEGTLKIKKPEANIQEKQDEALSVAAAPTQRRSSPSAAPVSREPPNNSGNRPNVVRLSAAEREMATMMNMSDQEYARNKVALIKEGKMN